MDVVVFRKIEVFGHGEPTPLVAGVLFEMDGVVCLSILLEGGVMVSSNFTKRRQNGFKIGTRDKFATHLR